MRHVLWIGGPPGAGKTAIAGRLARRHGLRLYSADTRTWAHRDRAIEAAVPAAVRWESLTPEGRWAGLATDELVAMSLHAERGPMVVDDLRSLPDSPLVIAEGSTLPAWAVTAGIAEPDRAAWLIPTRAFRHQVLSARDAPPDVVRLYDRLAEVIEKEATAHAVPIVTVDGSATIDETADELAARFARAIAEGPVARLVRDRGALIREANLAVVAQVRAYYARPWATGTAETVIRDFMCECGHPWCTADIAVSIESAGARSVRAPGHRNARPPAATRATR